MAGQRRWMWSGRAPLLYHTITRTQALAFVIEILLAISALIIHSLAYPEHCRKTLWEIGGEAGWNSNPRLRIYFYANYQEPPTIPLLWTQRLSQTNLGVALVAVFACIAKLVLALFDQPAVLSSTFYDILLSTLWLCSVVAQSSGDLSDAEHLSFKPWYLERGCSEVAVPYIRFCRIALAAYRISVLSLVFYLGRITYLILQSAYACGKCRIFDGGAEKSYRHYWGLQADGEGNDEHDALNRDSDRQTVRLTV